MAQKELQGRRVRDYSLIRSLGEGGMGTVYLAEAQTPTAPVSRAVVKMLRTDLMKVESSRSMFAHEARLGTQLEHPHIARIYDVGEDDGVPFLVMEYVEGPSLSIIQDRVSELPYSFSLRIVAAVAEALHYAHNARSSSGEPMNIVHRDVSPHNILVSIDGDVKLIDFGVARSAQQDHRTVTGTLKGKLSYMAPEQFRGKADPRSDVFALGVVLYELLAGERLFRRPTEAEVMAAVLFDPLPKLPGPDALRAVCEPIVHKSLAREPAERYQSADELREEVLAAFEILSLECDEADLARVVREVASRVLSATVTAERSTVSETPQWTRTVRAMQDRKKTDPPTRQRRETFPDHPTDFDDIDDEATMRDDAAMLHEDVRGWAAEEADRLTTMVFDPAEHATTRRKQAPPPRPEEETQNKAKPALPADVKAKIAREPTEPIGFPESELGTGSTKMATVIATVSGRRYYALLALFLIVSIGVGVGFALSGGGDNPVAKRTTDFAATAAETATATATETATATAMTTHARMTRGTTRARAGGVLWLDTEPWSRARIGSRSLGNTPVTGARLPAGSHSVVLRTADGHVHRRRVTIRPNQPTKVYYRLGE